MEIILIAAMAANRVIGRGAEIPWHIPGEQQRFKNTTMGHTLVMGRKTFESIGRPLPGRKTVVISRRPGYRAAGCLVAHSLDEALALCSADQRVFIAGGGEIYRQALPRADKLILTILDRTVEGDIFFPEMVAEQFELAGEERVEGGDPYTVAEYRRRD